MRVTGLGTLVTGTPGAPCSPPGWAGSGPWWASPASVWTARGPTSRGCTPGEQRGGQAHYHAHYHPQGGQIPALDPAKHVRNKTSDRMVSTNQQHWGQNKPNDPMSIFPFLRQICHLINKPENKQLKNPINSFIERSCAEV